MSALPLMPAWVAAGGRYRSAFARGSVDRIGEDGSHRADGRCIAFSFMHGCYPTIVDLLTTSIFGT